MIIKISSQESGFIFHANIIPLEIDETRIM